MRALILVSNISLIIFLAINNLHAQDISFRTAIVQEISGVPVFLFSEPLEPYKVVGRAEQNMEILLMDVANYTSITKKGKAYG